MIIDFDITKNKQNLGKSITRRVSVQQHLKEIGGNVPRRKICGERKILLRKGISAKTRQLLLAAARCV
jgi:hypothetical protein